MGERGVSCPHCGTQFAYVDLIEIHCASDYGTEINVTCDGCAEHLVLDVEAVPHFSVQHDPAAGRGE